MNWKFLVCCLLSHSFVVAIEGTCLRGTRHMWQAKPSLPTAPASCSRPSLEQPGNGTAETAPAMAAAPTMKVLAAKDTTPEAGHPAVNLAKYVYQCSSRQLSKQQQL
ncbi:hypothetical protein KR018_007274 [Drosophila ironensis]|nr:hypothetical protein KR018_007274 [Drosophila ironensis]